MPGEGRIVKLEQVPMCLQSVQTLLTDFTVLMLSCLSTTLWCKYYGGLHCRREDRCMSAHGDTARGQQGQDLKPHSVSVKVECPCAGLFYFGGQGLAIS